MIFRGYPCLKDKGVFILNFTNFSSEVISIMKIDQQYLFEEFFVYTYCSMLRKWCCKDIDCDIILG